MNLDLEKILACPLCKGGVKIKVTTGSELGPEEGSLLCLDCGREYPIKEGMIDLRPDISIRGEGKAQWELDAFEESCAKMGYYKDHYGWARDGNIPLIVEDYRYPRIKGRLLEWLKHKDRNLILDVGCGVGFFLFEIMRNYPQSKLDFIGLDISKNNIYWLTYRKKEEARRNIIGILGDAESLPFKDGSFDTIISSEVIEHIFDKQKAINQMYRVLKTGGRLLMTTPAKPVVEFWKRFFWLPQQARRLFSPRKRSRTEKAAYDEPLTRHQLKRYLKETGFKIERFQQNALMPHESYFQFFPYLLSWSIVKIASFCEDHLKPLFSWAGLHYVVEAKKW